MLKAIEKKAKKFKALSRYVYYGFLDFVTYFSIDKNRLSPPRRLNFVGDGDFRKTGEEFLKYFIDIIKLKSTDHVLDVGCGIGRMAIPLTTYLKPEGSYDGFDIVSVGIHWCQEKISPKYPNFKFQLADITNDRYNPKGKYKASAYKFPYADQSFDFIFLTSVFTHMLPDDMENYLSEISRVLKKGGKCLVTYFLLNEESALSISKKESKFKFRYRHSQYAVENIDLPEAAVSYSESHIREVFEKYNLNIMEPFYYGSWSGRDTFLSFQDIVVAKRV